MHCAAVLNVFVQCGLVEVGEIPAIFLNTLQQLGPHLVVLGKNCRIITDQLKRNNNQ